jgi:hypothetical protein
MASGIASSTSQFGQPKLGRAIDTQPTIEVDAGTLCQVLLSKPLHLPVVAQLWLCTINGFPDAAQIIGSL